MKHFRKKTSKKGGELDAVKQQYLEIQGVYGKNLRQLERELATLTSRHDDTSERRHKECSQLARDLKGLKSRISAYEQYI